MGSWQNHHRGSVASLVMVGADWKSTEIIRCPQGRKRLVNVGTAPTGATAKKPSPGSNAPLSKWCIVASSFRGIFQLVCHFGSQQCRLEYPAIEKQAYQLRHRRQKSKRAGRALILEQVCRLFNWDNPSINCIIEHFCTLCRISTNQEWNPKSKKFHNYKKMPFLSSYLCNSIFIVLISFHFLQIYNLYIKCFILMKSRCTVWKNI